jgi:DNA-binding SARP family transcriptional activator
MSVNSGLSPGQRLNSFRLTVLGGICVSSDEGLLVDGAVQRRHLALLAVLSVHWKTGISREKLAALLWPESDEPNSRNSLKQALHILRRELGPSVVSGTTQLCIGLPSLTCDLVDFEERLTAKHLEDAVAVYAGAFIDGFHLGHDAEEFERWVDCERTRLARRHVEALETLAANAASVGDHRSALRWWTRLAELAPLESRFTEGAATTLFTLGDLGGALRLVESHRAVLNRELSLPIGVPLERLTTAIRLAQRTKPAALAPSSEPAPLSSVPPVRAVAEKVAESEIMTSGTVPAAALDPPRPRRRGGWPVIATVLSCIALAAGIGSVGVAFRSPKKAAVDVDPMRVAIIRAEEPSPSAASLDLSRSVASGIAERLSASTSAKPVIHVSGQGTDVREVGRLAGARFALSVSSVLDTNAIEVNLVDVATGEQLWSARQLSTSDSSRGTSVDALTERAATAVALRLDPLMTNWIAQSSQPTSLDAYHEFARAFQLYNDVQPESASVHFARAARDSQFTMALVMEAWSDIYAGERTAADSVVHVLQSSRLAALDAALVDHLVAVLSGDLGAEYRASLAVSAGSPKSEWRYLQAESALKVGRARESVRLLDEMGPDLGWLHSSFAYWHLFARALHFLGQDERDLVVITAALERFPTNRILIQDELKALAGLGRVADVEATVEQALTLRPKGNWGDMQPMEQTVWELRAHGQPDAARRLAVRTLAWVKEQPTAMQAEWAGDIPSFLYQADSLYAARRALERLLAVSPRDDYFLSFLAVVCAELGDKTTARQIAARLTQPVPSRLLGDRLMDRASVAASLDEREAAVGLIRDAYRAGYEWRTVVHILPGMTHLRGYPPYGALIHSVQ